MFTEQLKESLGIAAAPIPPASYAGATTDTGGVDMGMFNRVTFVLETGVFAGGATLDMKLQASIDNVTFVDISTLATFTNTAITQLLAAGGNNRVVALEMHAGQLTGTYRYVRARTVVAGAAVIFGVLPIGAVARFKPVPTDAAAVTQRLALGN